ncbi:hypothetical protein ACLMJK_009453 [Lecanora helva]
MPTLQISTLLNAAFQIALTSWRYVQPWHYARTTIFDLSKVVHSDNDEHDRLSQSALPCLNEPWSRIVPSKELDYQPCFGYFQCALVDLPLDWNGSAKDDRRVQLAVTKLPAKVPISDERYGGLIWLQDGGPGLSGVDLILSSGKSFQTIVDSGVDASDTFFDSSRQPKYFDLIAIDSRGLNNSSPCFSCFPTLKSREAWESASTAEGILDSSNVSFQTKWARMQAVGRGCSRDILDNEGSSRARLGSHVNTTPQIADMVAILELHGKWREREAWQQIRKDEVHHSEDEISSILDRTRWRQNEEKLNFWGFSYGTVIGATFAAMQPHRIGRVVLDGVVDTEDYYTGGRLTALFDTDHVLERLVQHCYAAGPERCALYTDGGAPKILNRLQSLLNSLKRSPVGIPSAVAPGPQLITYSDVIGALFNSLYAPVSEFPALANGLHGLLDGNGTTFAACERRQQQQQRPLRRTEFAPEQSYDRATDTYASQECVIQRDSPGDTRTAIICTDSNTTFGMTSSDFMKYIVALEQQSSMFANLFAQVRMKCVAWDLKAKWRFPGPFAGNPANPMLMLGTVADPVTPLRNAHLVAERFNGSAVLAVNGEGHCSLSSPSVCAARYVQQYFQLGVLPPKDAVCDVNEKAFLGLTRPVDNNTDKVLLQNLRWLARHWA